MLNFQFHDVGLKRDPAGKGMLVKGEVINSSGRNYNAVVFRVTLFARTVAIGNTTFIVNGFLNSQCRTFEKQMEDLEFEKIAREVTKCDIYAESAY